MASENETSGIRQTCTLFYTAGPRLLLVETCFHKSSTQNIQGCQTPDLVAKWATSKLLPVTVTLKSLPRSHKQGALSPPITHHFWFFFDWLCLCLVDIDTLQTICPKVAYFFSYLVPKYCSYFSHNPCDILQQKHVSFWKYKWNVSIWY